MAIYECGSKRPSIGSGVFVADSASVIGDVSLGDECGIWFGAVLRGDEMPIRLGARTNVQDNGVVHITAGKSGTTIGDDVTIGHSAIVHACTIGHRVMVGMGAIVLDEAAIGHDCLIAAGSLVTPRTVIAPRSFVMGHPAKVVRKVTDAELEWTREAAKLYVRYGKELRERCRRIG